MPNLYKDLSLVSKETNLIWYPLVLNHQDLAILFIDGTSVDDWEWCVAPYEVIPKEERVKYPIAGKKNEYYTTRVSLKHKHNFEKNSFILAMNYLNFLLKDNN